MARFDFESPGAAATGAIAQVLTQRKAEERQRLLDSLQFSAEARAEQDTQRQVARDAQQTKESDARMASQRMHDEIAQVGALSANRRRGDNPDELGYAPEDTALLRKYGYIEDTPVPQVSVGESSFTDEQGNPSEGPSATPEAAPAPKMRPSFTGNAHEREDADLQKQSAMLISSMLQNPATKEMGQYYYEVAQANNGKLPADVVAKMSAPARKLKTFDQGNGKITDTGQTLGVNDEVLSIPRPYRPRQLIRVGENDKGETILGDPDQIRIGPDGTAIIPGSHSRTGGMTKQQQDLGIAQGTWDDHGMNVRLILQDASDDGIVDNGVMGGFRISASRLIGDSTATPLAKSLAKLYVNDPRKYAETIANGQIQGITQKDIEQLEQLKQSVAPDSSVEQLLVRNPVRKFAAPPAPKAAPPKAPTVKKQSSGQTIQDMMAGGVI